MGGSMGIKKDLKGMQFGMLTVVREATKDEFEHYYSKGQRKKPPVWLCKCECGNEVFRTSRTLATGEWYGYVQNCGCRAINKYKEKYDSYIGERFGDLTIVSYDDFGSETVFTCICDCGNKTTSDLYSLTSGHKKSCGCLSDKNKRSSLKDRKRLNLVGKKFGNLTVIEETEDRDITGCVIWKCQCDCGNIAFVPTHTLTCGATKSCGCLRSKGEMEIAIILTDNHIKFQKQYWFDDLRGEGNHPLMFDFAILNDDNTLSHLIEYDGIQHFMISHSGWNTTEHHNAVIRRDKIKTEYCLSHGIPLVRIPYTRFDGLCLEDLLLPSTTFLCAG